jgi:hypothetical protein
VGHQSPLDVQSLRACRLVAAATALTVAVPVLTGQLLAVRDGYAAARPCLAGLLARAAHIDAVVVGLPASMEARRPPP